MLAAYPAFLDYLLSVYTGILQQPTRTLENTRETRHVGSNGGRDTKILILIMKGGERGTL